MKCKVCNAEITPYDEFCPVCSAENDDFIDDEIEWVIVHKTGRALDAEMFKANLESADIPAKLLSQQDSMLRLDGNLSVIKIYVPKREFMMAKKIIEEIENDSNSE